MTDAIGRLAAILTNNRITRAINNGLINLIPLVLVGAFCVALINLPINSFHVFLDDIFAGRWHSITQLINAGTLEIIGLGALFSVSYMLITEESNVWRGTINPFIPMFTAFGSYVILFVWDGDELVFPHPGGSGMFYAIIVSILSVKLFFLFTRLWTELRKRSKGRQTANVLMNSAYRSIVPVLVTLFCFALLRTIFDFLFPQDVISAQFTAFINDNLVNDRYSSSLLTVTLMQFLWFFGAHGSHMVIDVFPAINTVAGEGMLFANKEFYLIFISLGGAGSTMGLVIALFLVGSRGTGKRFARISFFPALFNINEIMLYGVPIVFNPFFLLPFLLAPLLGTSVCCLAFSSGLVPPITSTVEWTTPIFFSGYLTTGSIAGSVLQFVCLALSVTLYVPFVLMYRRYDERMRTKRFEELRDAAFEAAENESTTLMLRNDSIGSSARQFVNELNEYLGGNRVPFHLVYQPKTDLQGHVVGAEALLRWTHPDYGPISPVVLVEMTDEAGLSVELGRWITRTAMREYACWVGSDITGFTLSINLNPKHLLEDPEFPDFVEKLMKEFKLMENEIELEITEHIAVHSGDAMKELFCRLKATGVALSIDDMGMGYSSLTYISDYGVSVVKIDTSLVSEITTDVQQQEIVRSIVLLAEQLGLKVIIEGVETREQVDKLSKLGCHYFQGYYFSKPLLPSDFVAFLQEHGVS
ncbi:MAG: EAL domain-containing protein [Coriobacteriales bacterium]|jgi:lactose/cellobiose-specific phosphotransferase system IIC component|nr:EAL domain-containing protein [Coriobacteriales bacterium]